MAALLKGNTRHLEAWAEDATFRGATVSARINRLAPPPNTKMGQIDITTALGSHILLDRSLSRPQFDEVITESGGQEHRLMENATDLGYAWLCKCDIAV